MLQGASHNAVLQGASDSAVGHVFADMCNAVLDCAKSITHWFHVLLWATTGGFDFDHLSRESSIHVLGLMRQLTLCRLRIVFDIELRYAK